MPSKKKGQTDSDMGSEKGDNGSSYGTLRDEGMHFVHVQLYQKAVESFTGALDLNKEHQKDDPKDDKLCLVTRAKCYLQLGNAEKALADAEEALELDKCYIRALLMKAEALYQMGDFETALVFFHRGHRERQELSEFRLGIQKAQEAINNSIGTPESVKLDTTGDLSFFEKQDSPFTKKVEKPVEDEKDSKSQGKKGGKTYSKPGAQKSTFKERERPKSAADSKTIRQLLEELYHDKEYLEKLFSDEAFTKSSPATGSSTNRENEIRGRVCDGLEYLNSRADFWRQQKPMYARKRDRERMEKKAKGKPVRDPTSYIMNGLETIEEKQQDGKYEDSLKIAKRVLKVVHGMSDDDLQNKAEITANIHSQMGNAYLEMGKYSQALEHHSKDRDIAQENDLEDAKSRALDNLGRVYARKGNYEKAIDLWKEKLPLSKSPLESTWLYHEIGRCYLELSDYKEAKDYGEKSIGCAKDADDNGWQLHATVLVAQAEVKMKDYQAAQESFEVALELSRITEDTAAEAAIKKALEDTKEKITQGYKEGEYSDEEEGVDGGGSPKSKGQSESKRPPSGDEESGAAGYEEDFEEEKDIDIPLMPASPVKRSAPSSPVKRSPEKMVRISPSPRASPTKNTHSPRKQSPTKGPESPKKGSPRGQSPSKKSVVSFKGDSPKGSARDAGKESPKMEDKGPAEETLEEKIPEPEVEKESQKEEIQREKSPEVEKEKETLKEEKAADSENVPEVEVEKEEQNEEQTPGQKSPQRTASPPKPSEEPLKSESKHSIKDDTKTDNVENGDKDTTVPSEEQTDQTEATKEAEKEAKKEES